MKITLHQIAYARSGDKGSHSNVGLMFTSKELYEWAKNNISTSVVKQHFKSIAKGEILRYEMDNLLALNFILGDSLGGGGSESLINDAQGKTHGQALLLMEVELPESLLHFISSK